MTETKTVLIVDDDEDFLLQQKVLLENAGFQVITANGQAAAEEILRDRTPDAALVDLMMEEQDGGFALCHHIKRDHPDMPVILVTAVQSETGLSFDAATDEERSWVKADAMLTKPVRGEQLVRELNRLMKA